LQPEASRRGEIHEGIERVESEPALGKFEAAAPEADKLTWLVKRD
jgi:hypothetical protein